MRNFYRSTANSAQANRAWMPGKAWRTGPACEKLPPLPACCRRRKNLGRPIARALSMFADGMRQERRQRAEELAAKTTVKMIFPLVLFIFPSMFIVLLAPAVLSIGRGLAGLAH